MYTYLLADTLATKTDLELFSVVVGLIMTLVSFITNALGKRRAKAARLQAETIEKVRSEEAKKIADALEEHKREIRTADLEAKIDAVNEGLNDIKECVTTLQSDVADTKRMLSEHIPADERAFGDIHKIQTRQGKQLDSITKTLKVKSPSVTQEKTK